MVTESPHLDGHARATPGHPDGMKWELFGVVRCRRLPQWRWRRDHGRCFTGGLSPNPKLTRSVGREPSVQPWTYVRRNAPRWLRKLRVRHPCAQADIVEPGRLGGGTRRRPLGVASTPAGPVTDTAFRGACCSRCPSVEPGAVRRVAQPISRQELREEQMSTTPAATIAPERQTLGDVEVVGTGETRFVVRWARVHRFGPIARELDLGRKAVRRCLQRTEWGRTSGRDGQIRCWPRTRLRRLIRDRRLERSTRRTARRARGRRSRREAGPHPDLVGPAV